MLTFHRALVLFLAIIIAGCNLQTVKQQPANTPSTPSVTQHTDTGVNSDADNSSSEEQINESSLSASPAPHQDLWLVIRDDLELDTRTDHVWVKSKLNWFKKNQDYMDRVSDRARPYLHHIVTRLKERNMPLDLALLPIVESAYQPFAYSHANASGIWQFISATGKRYGLKQNWWYDGRRDVVAATEAALDYLEMLHKRFKGNWLHALAAYNSGEGNVERAIRRNKRAGKPTDFWHLRLPRETRGYVPSLLAVAELLKNSNNHQISFKRIPNTPYFDQVDVGSQIDLATVSELSGLSMDEVYTLNPGFNRWATDPNGPHRILVPLERSDSFKQKLSAIPATNRVKWTKHTIKEGESLGVIARKYRTSVSAIKSANKLRGNLIRAGRSLLIPKAKLDNKAYTLSADARKFRGLKKTGDGKKYIYKVKRGDNLWDIGRNYGVSVRQMTRWNGISRNSILRPGQKLVVWVQDDENNQNNMVKVANQPANTDSYTVRSGDSLWLIARKFDIHVKDLVEWNKLNKKKPLQPGQTLIVRPAVTGA